jgi:hypothetical protein
MRDDEKDDNWLLLKRFLPAGWAEQAKRLGALRRQRKVASAEQLLRVLLIHLVDGCSLRETVARAREGKLAEISDVALLKRLRAASEWLRWMALQLLARRGCAVEQPDWLADYRVRSIDATVVREPGSTGASWRLHYSLELFALKCDHFRLTQPDEGESLLNFPVVPGDLLIGDRMYGTLNGFWHVRNSGGDFIVRIRSKAFPLYVPGSEKKIDLLARLRRLRIGEAREWLVEARSPDHKPMLLRVCAVRKGREAAEASVRRRLEQARVKQQPVSAKALEWQRYVVSATSAGSERLSAEQVLQCYRIRWQSEIAFKRLKSIMGLGHLPKVDTESARAWLHGKILAALLVQTIVDEGRLFSPWGYPLEAA